MGVMGMVSFLLNPSLCVGSPSVAGNGATGIQIVEKCIEPICDLEFLTGMILHGLMARLIRIEWCSSNSKVASMSRLAHPNQSLSDERPRLVSTMAMMSTRIASKILGHTSISKMRSGDSTFRCATQGDSLNSAFFLFVVRFAIASMKR